MIDKTNLLYWQAWPTAVQIKYSYLSFRLHKENELLFYNFKFSILASDASLNKLLDLTIFENVLRFNRPDLIVLS